MLTPEEKSTVAADAFQDQEIEAARAWFRESDSSAVLFLWMRVNDGEPAVIRAMTDDELRVVCSMALIGFHEAGPGAMRP